MDETTDTVKACLRLVRFFARESCGKCTPCREGTSWLEKILERIVDGHGRPSDVDLLLDVCDNISVGMTWPPMQTTICPLGQSATTPIASAVMRFKDEFEAYVGGPAETTVEVKGAAFVGPVDDGAPTVRAEAGAGACLRTRPRSPSARTRWRSPSTAGRSWPRRASWSSTPPSATASTSRGSATTRA